MGKKRAKIYVTACYVALPSVRLFDLCFVETVLCFLFYFYPRRSAEASQKRDPNEEPVMRIHSSSVNVEEDPSGSLL